MLLVRGSPGRRPAVVACPMQCGVPPSPPSPLSKWSRRSGPPWFRRRTSGSPHSTPRSGPSPCARSRARTLFARARDSCKTLETADMARGDADADADVLGRPRDVSILAMRDQTGVQKKINTRAGVGGSPACGSLGDMVSHPRTTHAYKLARRSGIAPINHTTNYTTQSPLLSATPPSSSSSTVPLPTTSGSCT